MKSFLRWLPLILFGLVIPLVLANYSAWELPSGERDYIALQGYTVYKQRGARIAYLDMYPDPNNPFAPPAVRADPRAYAAPKVFVLVNPDTARIMVSDHYDLGDFAKDEPMPLYIALKKSLLKKLEALAQQLSKEGICRRPPTIISGFRSPAYTQKCMLSGNTLKAGFSRHQYGDAVDIIIDENPEDGVMDDLNRDGVIDIQDALFLKRYVRRVEQEGCERGGLGFYSNHDIPNRIASPYVHLDCRGYATPEWTVASEGGGNQKENSSPEY